MKFRPLHDRVVVRRIEAEEKTKGGIIIPDTAKEKPQEGEVIAVGPGARDENGRIIPSLYDRNLSERRGPGGSKLEDAGFAGGGFSSSGPGISHSWLTASKNDRMSASKMWLTLVRVIPTASASSASCAPRPGRKPYENPRKSSS